jgi:hypothetical protein
MNDVLYWCSWASLAVLALATLWLGYLARLTDHD